MSSVDIVIPVYSGYRETRRCLESVMQTLDPAWARMVVVNDCSPDPDITRFLRDLAAVNKSMVLLENHKNRGFVSTANRGMAHDSRRDILLLNSDVEVAGDWLHRLREAAYRNPVVGSVTPFSNNATICSFPNFCEDNRPLFGLSVAELDAFFAERYTCRDVVEVPTGVGFCMYIRRDCLDTVGYFDEATFGRGYGEENDWCQRAEQAGWKNYHVANCYVYHEGGVSFGEEQDPRVEAALRLLDEKYPRYHANVAEYIARDPFRQIRIEVLFSLLARQDKPKIVAISHKLGGGAQQHVDELVALYGDDTLFLQITPDRDGESVILSVFDDCHRLRDGLYFDVSAEYDKLLLLLRELGVGRVHFHHTMGLHPRMWRLGEELGCGHDLTVHDYFLVNGNPTLTDRAARYVSEDAPDFDRRCEEHYPLPEGIDGDAWRRNQKLMVEGADRVIFPSHDCAERFQRFFEVNQAIIAWHPDYLRSQPYPPPRWTYTPGRPLKVLVLGAISREKGADVLEQVAERMAGRPVEFHLLGYAYRALSNRVITHGPYDNREAYPLVRSIAPDVVWYPALWPETYSYTLSIALHLGLPVVVPDIGAFRERVSGRPLSVVCPWNRRPEGWRDFWLGVLEEGFIPAQTEAETRVGGGSDVDYPVDTGFYQERYLAAVTASAGELDKKTLESLATNLTAGRPELSRSERMLGRLWRLSRTPVAARLISVIPFRMQRAIKRRFSSRPMHDIVGRQ
jgi:GT2 family glycosyltransferase/glycosyltransferase involved in cell wall biosynthesis